MLTFDVVDDARRTLGALHRLHEAGHIRLSAAAVVGRRTDGRAFAVEQPGHPVAGNATGRPADVAQLLNGPYGVVLEHAPDALVGSLVDIADVEKSHQLLRCFGNEVPPGRISTIALVAETTPDAIEAVRGPGDAVLIRKSRQLVEAEIGSDHGPSVGAGAAAEEARRRRRWFRWRRR